MQNFELTKHQVTEANLGIMVDRKKENPVLTFPDLSCSRKTGKVLFLNRRFILGNRKKMCICI